ncbi:MAG: S-adenosylmethionine:tRNA ribosyltransferase-isomerase, partial [Limisphaerales bacterium]
MRTADFDYTLPPERIAQHPTPQRTESRLMRVNRASRTFHPGSFLDLPNLLRAGDLLILNNSRVLPARLFGRKLPGGGSIEILLLEPAAEGGWWVLLRPGKRVRPGSQLEFGPGDPDSLPALVAEKRPDGSCRIEFPPGADVQGFAGRHGVMPLPPYIRRPVPLAEDRERYQTVYARETGSNAAPTAGLHFSVELLRQLRDSGVEIAEVTLHVGLGTFAPVKVEAPED